MQQQIQFNLSYYVTSYFALLPLTGTTGIVAGIVGGVIKLVCISSFPSLTLIQIYTNYWICSQLPNSLILWEEQKAFSSWLVSQLWGRWIFDRVFLVLTSCRVSLFLLRSSRSPWWERRAEASFGLFIGSVCRCLDKADCFEPQNFYKLRRTNSV